MEKKVKRYRNPNQRLNKWGYIFIAPFILTFLVFSLYPMISSIAMSFTNDNGKTVIENFNAFSNYKLILTQPAFWHTYINTIIIFGMNFIPQIISALFFAVLFTSRRIRMKGKGFFQFVYFLPNILTATSVSALFIFLFSPIFKAINDLPNSFYTAAGPIVFGCLATLAGAANVAAPILEDKGY